MCMGGGSKSYDAFKTGDYNRWLTVDDRISSLEQKIAAGNVPMAQRAQVRKQIAALTRQANILKSKVEKDPAARLDQREHDRQQNIGLGKTNIDRQFNRFNDNYYNKYSDSYTDFYNPQLNDQFEHARGKLIAALAGKGNLESTAGIGMLGRLTKERDTAGTTIANQAQDAANKLRGNVEKTKSDMYSLNESAADAASANTRAAGEATALVAPPAFDPLGQVFAGFLGSVMGGLSGGGQRQQYQQYSSPFNYGSGGGSGTVYS